MHPVVERQAVIHFDVAAHNRTAQFEAVAVAVLRVVGEHSFILEGRLVAGHFVIELGNRFAEIAVFKGHAVVHYNCADVAVGLVCVKVPAVVGIAVGYAAVEHVSIADCELGRKAVGIFARSLVVVIVI